MVLAAASTAVSSAADRPDVPRTQAFPDFAMMPALDCAVAALVKSITTSDAAARAARSGLARLVPPVRVAPAAATSSVSSCPMRPVMPAMPMRVVMLLFPNRSWDFASGANVRPVEANDARLYSRSDRADRTYGRPQLLWAWIARRQRG